MNLLLHDYGNYPFTRQLARELAKRGHRVCYAYSVSTQIIQRNREETSHEHLVYYGIELERPFRKYNYLSRRRSEIEHGRKLAGLIDLEKPDVVISANTPIDAQRYVLSASRRNNAKFVFWLQDLIGLATLQTLSRKLPVLGSAIGTYYSSVEKRLLKSSDRIVLIADDFLPLMLEWGIDRNVMQVIPNWAPLEDLPVLPKRNRWSEEHGLADKFCFMFTGILGLKHNPALFVHLAEAFRAEETVRVVVLSEGGTVEWLRQQKSGKGLENLVILPPQPAGEYAQVLGSGDVLMAILSRDAGRYSVPSKVLSYMCAGRPLLLAVPPENMSARLVIEHNMGLTGAPDDVPAWTGNAQRLYRERDQGKKMANNAREYAQKIFNIGSITDRFEEMIRKSLDR